MSTPHHKKTGMQPPLHTGFLSKDRLGIHRPIMAQHLGAYCEKRRNAAMGNLRPFRPLRVGSTFDPRKNVSFISGHRHDAEFPLDAKPLDDIAKAEIEVIRIPRDQAAAIGKHAAFWYAHNVPISPARDRR